MSNTTAPALRYLRLAGERIRQARQDIPHLTDLGQRMAGPLLRGGSLFTPKLGTFWPSEFGNRAGGLMGLKPPTYVARAADDVAFTTLPARWDEASKQRCRELSDSPAQIVVIGREEDAQPEQRRRVIGFTGGVAADEGPHPLAPLRPLEQLLRGWLTAGEMVAAMTRGGRMPILWMSVWLEGALVRNASFFRHDNVREPWQVPLFHDKIYIPPLAPGFVADAFLTELERIFHIVEAQSPRLAAGGAWMADALRAGKRVSTVLVGHSYPEILELAAPKDYPLAWLPSISDLREAHPNDLSAGDVALHLGYSPVDVDDVQRILDRGVRFIYTSPYGRPAALKDRENLLWLDLPWRAGDATVDIPGYSVRLLPMSSSAHTLVYFSLVCEMAQRLA